MEDLEMLKAQEANKNVGNQKPVAVSDSDSKPAAKDNVHDVKDEAVKSDKYSYLAATMTSQKKTISTSNL